MKNNCGFYPIGELGKAWGSDQKKAWLQTQNIKRSYEQEVAHVIKDWESSFEVQRYGVFEYVKAYELFLLKTPSFDPKKPTVLVTGGVHGYETSGVHGALAFAKNHALHYSQWFNVAIAPCVSPWGYEVINRWNPDAIDPNRSFYDNSPAKEAYYLMEAVKSLGEVLVHFDLHETTNTDESEFRPALAARDGLDFEAGSIPDGFYVVDDENCPQEAFQKAIIEGVKTVTHIAPADEQGLIIGSKVVDEGVIRYPLSELGLCAGMTGAKYTCTTEVYPDSPSATPKQCNDAQVAAVCGGLEYVKKGL